MVLADIPRVWKDHSRALSSRIIVSGDELSCHMDCKVCLVCALQPVEPNLCIHATRTSRLVVVSFEWLFNYCVISLVCVDKEG